MIDIGAELQRAFDEGYEAGKADRQQGEWIPCSERLPEETGFHICTVNRELFDVRRMKFELLAEGGYRWLLENGQVNHINGVRDDNKVENLERCTAKENVKHSFDVLDSTERRKKMSAASRGRKRSEESLKKQSETLKGRKFSDETRKRMSDARKGKPNPCRAKSVMCIETGIKYRTITEAAKATECSASSISEVLSGKKERAKGYRWETVKM